LELQPGESLPVGSNYTQLRDRESFTIKVESPRGSRVFVPESFASVDVGANLVITWRQVDETLDVQGLEQADVPAELWPLVQQLQLADFTPIAPPTPTPDPNATPPAEASPTPTVPLQLPPVPDEIRLAQETLVERGINTSFAIDTTSYRVSTLNYTGLFPVYDSAEAVFAREGLDEGDIYTVDALMSDAQSAELRTAGIAYPDEITERYLALPETVTQRTLDLAQQLGTQGNNPYDISKAIERYLRDTIVYNEQVAFPPADVDVVDFVLFQSQQGYCEYYASAFIVLARANGLPTRMVTGFAPSEESIEGGFLYREQQAHAWPEVYFPGYGWIAFEPTAARNVIEREPAEAVPGAPGSGNVPQDRRGEGLVGGGLDAGDIDFMEENVDLPSGVGALGQADDGASWTELAIRIVPLVLLLIVLVVAYLWLRGLRGLSPAAAMYTRVSRGASWSGIQRDPAMTANEYAQAIGDSVPGSRQPVRYLTDLYVSETYSPRTATQSELLRARQAWMRLRSLFLKNVFLRLRPWGKHEDEQDTEEW
jgi:transglutaminase-like putative cysteine protease